MSMFCKFVLAACNRASLDWTFVLEKTLEKRKRPYCKKTLMQQPLDMILCDTTRDKSQDCVYLLKQFNDTKVLLRAQHGKTI